MDNRKMNLDRSPVSSEQIQAKQNFDAILSNYKLLKKPFYKSKWFWGTTGLATFGLVTVFGLNNFKSNTAYDDKTTLTNSEFKTIILPEDTPCILPVKENAVPFDLHTVLPLKGDTLILKDGSEIIVPAGSLLAKDIHEPVKIKTRVFHDKTSAFLAGIKAGFWTLDSIEEVREKETLFSPIMTQQAREAKYNGWLNAVERTKSK